MTDENQRGPADPTSAGQPTDASGDLTESLPAPQPSAYTPPAEPRPTWTQEVMGPSVGTTPSHWLEPEPAGSGTTPPVGGTATRSTGRLAAMLLGVAILAAAFSSGGTYLLLRASGALTAATTGSTPTADNATQKTVQIDEQSAVTRAAATVSPAVVTITTRQGQSVNPFSSQTQVGVGSGIIYGAGGWILTNRHVVCGADSLTVTLKDGRELTGKTYGVDTLTDLAIVKVDGSGLPTAPLGESSDLKPGQLAVAIGSPLGDYTNSVTAGVISGSGRDIQVSDECTGGQTRTIHHLIQTDAAINPGNSGGALVDSEGQVIGINTAVAGQAQGIGFAIPIDVAKPIMRQAVAGQQLARPYMGVVYQAVTPQLKAENDLPIDYGAWLHADSQGQGTSQAVVSGGPADKAGLKADDIITAINGQRIDATHILEDILIQQQPGESITVTVLRDGKTQDVRLTLGTRPADLP